VTSQRTFLWLCTALASIAGARAQHPPADEGQLRAAASKAIRLWLDDYEHDALGPRGPLRSEAGLQPRYVEAARAADLLAARDLGALTHFDALQKIVFAVEQNADEAVGDALLDLAAVGIEKSLFDADARTLRDLGHSTLLRSEHRGVWFLILRAAAGEQLPLLTALRPGGERVPVARRAAALELLGQRGLPVFRGVIEACTVDLDPRVRLAAVEALAFQRRPESLPLLLRCAGAEHHPVVSQAVVHALRAVLQTTEAAARGDPAPAREAIDRAMTVAVHQFGRCGWRTDMELVDLVAAFPRKEAIPCLIDLLQVHGTGDDPLVLLVNENATPLLRDRACTCLHRMTGAVFAADQHRQWREFWLQERDRIVVPGHLPEPRTANATRSGFFGIPVTGRSIAFVIDTSGSMKEPFGVTSTERGRGRAAEQATSRLAAAKEQVLLAVSAMAPEARYQLLTFDSEAKVWSRRPVPPTPASTRSLTEVLSHLKADGGTDVYDALSLALTLDRVHFGDETAAAVDEMFLLSDGEPTAGAVREPDEILRLVREANRYLKVRINTVFAGNGPGQDFLRRLAAENGGVFVQR
jgi:hypothetical protein